jgi:predicted phage-related endonuclease
MGLKITTNFRTGVSSSKMDAILNKSKYKSVIEQYLLDTKQITETVTEVGRQKMEMGKVMEPIIKDLSEKYFSIKLTVDKNRYQHDVHEAFTIEFDALDWENKVVYEFKNTEKDESTILETYYAQVQFAMFMIGWNEARICYLRNGWELGYIIVKRDQNFLDNMEIVGNYYAKCLKDREQPDPDYINSIVANINFYTSKDRGLKGVGQTLDLTPQEIVDLYAWNDLKRQIAALELQEQTFKSKFSEKYGKYSDGAVTFTNTETLREGGINISELLKDNPQIDIRKYTKEATKFSRQLLRVKQPKEEVNIGKFTEDLV